MKQNFKVIYNIKINDNDSLNYGLVNFDNIKCFNHFFDAFNFIRSLKLDKKNKVVGIPVIEEVK